MKKLFIIFLSQAIIGQASSQTGWQVRQYTSDTSTLFANGWTSTLHKDYVLAEKDSVRVYLFYPVSTIHVIKPNVFSIRRYFWTHYLKDMFINSAATEFLEQPSHDFLFRQGIANDKKTGQPCFIRTDTILDNTDKPNATAAFIVWTLPYTRKSDFWEVNNKSIRSFYRFCNRFLAIPDSITGHWKEVVYIENYNPAPGYSHGAHKTYFQFENDSSYRNRRMGYAGGLRAGLWQSPEFRGTFKLSNGYLLLGNRNQGKTEKFEYWFEAAGENIKILHLKNEKGEHYKLLKYDLGQ